MDTSEQRAARSGDNAGDGAPQGSEVNHPQAPETPPDRSSSQWQDLSGMLGVEDGSLGAVPESEGLETAEQPHLVRGAKRVIQGPIRSAVFWLALPVLGEQLLNASVTWNDAILAGRISAEATGAVGIAGYVSWLMTMLFALVSIGATAIVARAIGAGDRSEASRATNQALLLALIAGVLGMIFAIGAAPVFASLLNMRGQAAVITVDYLRIDALGFTGAAVSFALAACLRGAGNTRTPMIILGGVNLLNLVISWVLAFGVGSWEGIGVNGIAAGTAIARWLGAIWIVRLLLSGRRELSLEIAGIHLDRALVGRILNVGLPAAVDGAIVFSGHFVFTALVTRIPGDYSPSVLYAAQTVAVRIVALTYLPAYAWSLAASTIVGQNLGARRPERATSGAHEATLQATGLLVLSGLLYFFAAQPLFHLFSEDPAVWACGIPTLRWYALFQLAMAPLSVYVGALRGAGDTRVPMIISAFGLGLIRLPLGALFGIVLQGGLLGAWIGVFADLIVRGLLMAWRFRAGGWRRIRV